VFVLKDIMANGYRAGGNTKFFAKGGSLSAARDNLQKRLNFEDVDEDPASLLAFPMSPGQYESGALDTVMSVTTRLLPYEVNSATHSSFPGGEVVFNAYNTALGLQAIHFGEDLRATENMEYMSQVCAMSQFDSESSIAHRDIACEPLSLTSCACILRTGFYQQRAVLPRPVAQVQQGLRGADGARARHGPLGPRRAARRRARRSGHRTLSTLTPRALRSLTRASSHACCARRRAGAAARRCR
jgi:hypothetical protein